MEKIRDLFAAVRDFRQKRRQKFALYEVLVLALCAIICGAEDFHQIEDYCNKKIDFFRRFLALPHGIPSHDTFNRIFNLLGSDQLLDILTERARALVALLESEQIAHVCIDGKKQRGSAPTAQGNAGFWTVTAWLSKYHLVLGQQKVAGKSNEKKAIPELIAVLDLRQTTVSIDAMGCQKNIALLLRQKLANYILSLKNNNKRLYRQVLAYYQEFVLSAPWPQADTQEQGHGRIEKRNCYVLTDLSSFDIAGWPDLKAIVIIEAQREVNGKIEKQVRFYLSNLVLEPLAFNKLVRNHWSIENHLHWALDVALKEDQSRLRTANGPSNMNIFRKIALQMILASKGKLSMKRKIKLAGWDDNVLIEILKQA